MWYDDPESLALKYRAAAELGLRGVGMWHLDALAAGRGSTAAQRAQTTVMWDALQAFTNLTTAQGDADA